MIVSLKTWPYVCVGRREVVLVIEVYLGAAIKIQKGEPRNIAQEVSSTVYEVTKKTNKETENQNKF